MQQRFDVKNVLYNHYVFDMTYEVVPLGDLCEEEPCYGTSAKAIERTDEKSPKYIRITDFNDWGIEKSHKFMKAESYAEKHLLKPNDILFARTGGTVGKTYFYDGKIGEAVFAGYCIRFRFDGKKVVPKYIYWCTKTEAYKEWIESIQRPSGQPNINKEEYKSYGVILPDLKKQMELCAFMDSSFEAYQKKSQEAENMLYGMSEYIHSILGMNEEIKDKPIIYAAKGSQVFHKRIDPEYHNPFYTHRISQIQKQEYDILGNIVEFSAESWKQKELFDTAFPYIEISGVKLKENTYETIDVPVNEAPSRAKMIVRNGDIIVSTTRPHRGAIATIVCSDTQVQIASTGFCVLRNLKRDDVLKEYLQWILLDDYVLFQMLQRSSGGNYPAISGDELKNVVIPIPDIDIQRKICKEARKRKIHAYVLRQEAEQEWEQAKVRFEEKLLGE